MASVLQITDGVNTVNMLTGTLYVKSEGFEMKAPETEDTVWTAFTLFSSGTAAAIRTEKAKLDKLINQARVYVSDPNEDNPVWLYWQSEGESAKRALIYEGTSDVSTMGRFSPILPVDGAVIYLAVKHNKVFESSAATSINTTTLDALGGTWAMANDAGTTPQRISSLKVSLATATMVRQYIGIRNLREGSAGFDPVWESEDGTNYALSGTSDQADAAASSGNCVEIDFTTYDTLKNRFNITWLNVNASGNWDDIIGTYLVLARVKMDAAGVHRIQLHAGWNAEEIIGDTYLDTSVHSELNGNYCLVPLGTAIIPPTGNRSGLALASDALKNYMMTFYAGEVSGSAKLRVDCFILIPSEHMVVIEKGLSSSGNYDTYAYTTEDGFQYAVHKTSAGWIGGDDGGNFANWNYPIGGGVLVFAACSATNSIQSVAINKSVRLDVDLYPRHISFRT